MKSEIIEIRNNFFRATLLSKTILFSDDTSVDIDSLDNSIVDMEGMFTVSKEKINVIEKRLKIIIQK